MVVNGQGAAAERAKVEAERKEQEEKKAAEEAVKKGGGFVCPAGCPDWYGGPGSGGKGCLPYVR